MIHLTQSLRQSNADIRLLWLSTFIRMASFGVTNQILTLYLKAINIEEAYIGWFMALTLVGDTILSYYLTWYSDHIGRRRVMIFGSLLMVIAGLTFSSEIENFYVLLLAAIVGVISPSGNDTGPFKSIEEACMAHMTPANHRPEIYAVHWLATAAGAALGSLMAGAYVDYFKSIGWEGAWSYRCGFYLYTFLAVAKFVSILFLSNKCEASYVPPFGTESTPLLLTDEPIDSSKLSPKTRKILLRLLICFMLDSFGYGFMTPAWVVYYFKVTYKVSATFLGGLFFVNNILSSGAAVPSAWLAKLLGPISSSLYTQIPAGVAFIFVPIFETQLTPSVIFLLINQMLSATDVVPRQVLLTTLISPHELTKVLGTVNVGKTAARTIGPVFTGHLSSMGYLWVNYWISGGLLILSNVLLGLQFKGVDREVLDKQAVIHDI
ncbi:BA75_03779T0 [Komagataella pastoris]|uniref:BA75_03779T0 n=1 Tax=Komagataella pastoris TaxID=4922 RepID=A0A1B2JG53_PICPA|nr:BA75_03779T0 [Komagataella pastoris]